MLFGSVFAVRAARFFELGAWDLGYGFGGGENLELSLRNWMCGGQVAHQPNFNPLQKEKEGKRRKKRKKERERKKAKKRERKKENETKKERKEEKRKKGKRRKRKKEKKLAETLKMKICLL